MAGCPYTPRRSLRNICRQPDGDRTPKFPPRHRQGAHADELSHKGVPEKGIPDGKWEAEAGCLLPLLWRY